MRSYWYCLVASVGMLVVLRAPCQAREYRVDSQKRFDSLAKAAFRAGDVILFKRGARFSGMFSPWGNGRDKAPIRIGAYGKGDRPRIDAGGKHKAGLLLRDPSFWEVSGLEITNTDGTDEDQGKLCGVYVLAKGKEATYRHVYINDCYVHDVNGKVGGKQRGGIHVHIRGRENSKFHDLRITGNRIVRVGGVGIGNNSDCGWIDFCGEGTISHNLWTKVYVADNFIDSTGRNNVIARVSKDAVYERNVLANSSRYSTGHSIFCFFTDGIKIQYNEAYGNVGPGGIDRGGFDADYNCINTFIQYNYSHDNLWFCGIMKNHNRNVVIRYNVSQNDREGIYFYGFEGFKEAKGIHIYNNTHFVRKGLNVSVFATRRRPINTLFENNIFYFEGRGKWGRKPTGPNTTFRNNVYFNITPHKTDTKAIVADPKFVQPGRAPGDIDLKTLAALRGYHLKPASPCIDKGRTIKDCGGKDIRKNKVIAGKADIGAVERTPGRWSKAKANQWYAKQPWPCGFNYIPANAISYTEMWMPYCFDAKLIDKELALAEGVGFNCLRVVLPFVVWEHDPKAFKKRLEEFLGICDKRGIRVMFTLFDDCRFGPISDPKYGKQPKVVPGHYANGWTPSPGHSMVRDPKTWPRLEKYVKDIISSFKDDRRVWVWDLYNEPTNSVGAASLPLVRKVFVWAREGKPSQPLTVGRWNGNKQLNEIVLLASDVITFHQYAKANALQAIITDLKKQNRPLICTEWMARTLGSRLETHLPIFRKEEVGCMHWGLVNGKTQTHYAWGSQAGAPAPKLWFVDLYRKDHTPYDPKEIAVLKQHIALSKASKQ